MRKNEEKQENYKIIQIKKGEKYVKIVRITRK